MIVAQGEISPGDIILQVNGDAVGGFIHWDLLCEIRRSGSLLTLLLVPQGKKFVNYGVIIVSRDNISCATSRLSSRAIGVASYGIFGSVINGFRK